jgi:hypothetical protein
MRLRLTTFNENEAATTQERRVDSLRVPEILTRLIPEIMARLEVPRSGRSLPVPAVVRPVERREEDARNAEASRSRSPTQGQQIKSEVLLSCRQL